MKLLKRIFFAIVILLGLLVGGLWFVATQYEEELIGYVKQEIGKQTSRPINVSTIEYNLFASFPNISVSLNDVQTYSFEKGDQPFLNLKSIHIVFDLMSLIDGEFNINQIILQEGQVNIIYNEKGEPNYNILKESSDSTSSQTKLAIENILLQEVEVGYFDKKEKQSYAVAFNEAEVLPESLLDSVVAKVEFDGELKPFNVSDFKTVQSIPLDGEFKIENKSGALKFLYAGTFQNGTSNIEGEIQTKEKGDVWDFKADFNDHQIKELIQVLPKDFLDKDLRSVAGLINATVSIVGEKTTKKSPPLKIDYEVTQANYKSGDHLFKSINAKGQYFQPNLNNIKGAKLVANSFSTNYDEIVVSGSGSLKDFKRPLIDAKLKSKFDLAQLHKKILQEDFKTLKGAADFDIHLKGRLVEVFADRNLKSLKYFKSEGKLILDGVEAQPADFDYPIYLNNGNLNFKNKNLSLESFEGNLQSSKFKMEGQITNYLKTVLANEPLTFDADLEMDQMILEEFVGSGDTSKVASDEVYNFNLPSSILLRTNLKLGAFSFRKFRGEDISGEVTLKDQKITFKDLHLKTCDGSAQLNGIIDARPKNKVVYRTKSKLENIDAGKAFVQFENFGQDLLLAKHVKGRISIASTIIAESDKQLNIDENKIYTETNLKIKNGELVQFEPLIELQQYLNEEFKLNFNLSHLKFSTLENDIEINNGTIYIPEMAIRSSDLNLDLEGTHSFNQDIDYLLKIKHSEIFKAKKQNKIEAEFGVVENNDKTATLPLRMKGNIDDPKFSYDVKTKRQTVAENWKKESKEIKQILKEEFSGGLFKGKKDKKEEKEEEEDLNKEIKETQTEVIWDEEDDDEEEGEEE